MGKHRRKEQFTLSVTTFHPKVANEKHKVPDADALRRLLARFRRRKLAAIYLELGDEGPHLMAHLNGDRAWLTYFSSLEVMDGYAYDPEHKARADKSIGFRLDNGQEDFVHPYWTVA